MGVLKAEQKRCCRWVNVSGLAMKSLKKRLIRACMTMAAVVLSIAFLTYTWLGNDIITALKELNSQEVNSLLLRAGIDLTVSASSGKTQWLVMLSLMVTSVGILNAMLMSVTERFKEIGTMKCIGATNRYIIRLFVVEAAIQGFAGTVLGILLGGLIVLCQFLFSFGLVVITAFPLLAGLYDVILAVTIGVGLTVVFALYPAYTAANMLPVAALRVEE